MNGMALGPGLDGPLAANQEGVAATLGASLVSVLQDGVGWPSTQAE